MRRTVAVVTDTLKLLLCVVGLLALGAWRDAQAATLTVHYKSRVTGESWTAKHYVPDGECYAMAVLIHQRVRAGRVHATCKEK